jgi:hypothetical protein
MIKKSFLPVRLQLRNHSGQAALQKPYPLRQHEFMASDNVAVPKHGSLSRFASSPTFEYLFAMANEIAIVDAEDLRKRAGALRRFL